MSAVAAGISLENAYSVPEANLDRLDVELSKDRLFSSQGRLSRLAYNARFLYGMLLLMLGMVPMGIASALSEESTTFHRIVPLIFILLGSVVLIAAVFVLVVSTIKRLHDLDRSGWYWLFTLVPLLSTFFSLYICVVPGNEAANKFGAKRQNSKTDVVFGWIGVVLMCVLAAVQFLSKFYDAFIALQ